MKGISGRLKRALVVIAVSVVIVLTAGLVYLREGSTLAGRTAANSTPTPKASPRVGASPWNQPCPPTELSLTGIFNECASVNVGMSCPSGSFDQARVLRLHGTKDDFILYVEVNGSYHGPGTYALAPWPSDTLGKPDGVAKVAIREWSSGTLFESAAGSLTIDTSEESGWVYAGLGASSYSTVDVKLNIAGWWSCSQAQLPPARSGATACLPTGGEATMLQQLAKAGLSVDAASASVASAFFPLAASVCLMDVGSESFEAAFFEQRSLAAAVRVCESRSGSRYLYRVGGRTMDSAYKLYWSVAGDALIWTQSSNLDISLRRDLNGVPPPC
jgi:hypothetical protein